MPPAKFTKAGKTVRRVRATIQLHPDLHRFAKRRAGKLGISDYVAGMLANQLGWQPKGSTIK